ncbi:hypothetical protein [Streptomyces sp. NPDC056660]|uniref:hypothetical protein n=1 Tax=Streptomyces sp. NPDC056660 TaxID=3345897 RepID=UPI0036C1C3EC
MSRWGTLFTRLAPARGQQPGGTAGELDTPVLVDRYDGLTLLRPTEQAVPGPDDVAELARSLGAEGGQTVATVVVGVDGPVPPALWTRLGDVLDTLREDGTTTLRLVVSGAGSGGADRPALAQRIADAWGFGVIAPEGSALLVPGGTLFVPDPVEPSGGWQLFQPGTEPTPLGVRHPAPGWQTAFAALPEHTAGGYTVRPVPAGVLLQPPGTPPPAPGALCHAVPVDTGHPTVLVGVPGPGGGARIPADDLAALLAALPAAVRARIRVAPGAEGDLLPAVQQVADALDIEVEVLTGPPLAARAVTPDADADAVPGSVLVDGAGRPTWRPYVEAVVCRPAASGGDDEAPGPRLLRWRSPVPDAREQDAGVVRLSERWQVAMTRSGLALGPAGQPPLPLADRPVLADQLAVEIGPSDQPLDETCWSALSHVLDYLDPEAREYAVLHAPGRSAEESRMLRRLAVQHGVRMLWPPTAGADPDALPEPAADAQAANAPAAVAPAGEAPAPDGFSRYRERIGGIVQAANGGRYDDATTLATALEREAFTDHGSEHPTSLQIRQIRAHVMRLAGHNALAADLYRRVAFSLLVTAGMDSVDAEQAAANADACWRDTADIALALRIAPSIISLRRKVPGPNDRWLRAAERYREQLEAAHATPPAPHLPSAVPVPVTTPPATYDHHRTPPSISAHRPPAAVSEQGTTTAVSEPRMPQAVGGVRSSSAVSEPRALAAAAGSRSSQAVGGARSSSAVSEPRALAAPAESRTSPAVAESRSSSAASEPRALAAAAESRSSQADIEARRPPMAAESRTASALAESRMPPAVGEARMPPAAGDATAAATGAAARVRRVGAPREVVPVVAARQGRDTGVLSPQSSVVGRDDEAAVATSCSAVAGRP